MGNPTDKPNFHEIAGDLIGRNIGIDELAAALSAMYESGYHIGLIYGWGEYLEDDEVYQLEMSDKVQSEDKAVLHTLSGDNETSEWSKIIHDAYNEEPEPFDPV